MKAPSYLSKAVARPAIVRGERAQMTSVNAAVAQIRGEAEDCARETFAEITTFPIAAPGFLPVRFVIVDLSLG